MTWRDQASCLDHPTELWFPVGLTSAALAQVREAKAVCLSCPVMEDCLTWALDNDVWGVWGGTVEDERRALKRRPDRRLHQSDHGTPARYRAHHRAGEVPCDACSQAQTLVVANRKEFPRKGRIAPALGIGRPL